MSTEQSLLAAVLARPDDDVARLVLADWLEEHGRPARAEFIRVECRIARTDPDDPAHPELLRRADWLMGVYAARWFGPLAGHSVVEHVITHRGFIDTVVVTADRFAASADAILAHAPLLRRLHVTAAGDWRAFFAAPRMEAIRSLSSTDGVLSEDAAGELAASGHVGGLVELELDRQPLGPGGMAAVAAAPPGRLEKLSAGECGVGDEGAEALFAGAAFRNLRDLDLSGNGLSDAACHALAAAAGFGRLEELALCENDVGAGGVSALAAAPHLSRLRSLNLYANPIGPAGGRAILASRHWGGLRALDLTGCGVGVAVVGDLRWVYGERTVKA